MHLKPEQIERLDKRIDDYLCSVFRDAYLELAPQDEPSKLLNHDIFKLYTVIRETNIHNMVKSEYVSTLQELFINNSEINSIINRVMSRIKLEVDASVWIAMIGEHVLDAVRAADESVYDDTLALYSERIEYSFIAINYIFELEGFVATVQSYIDDIKEKGRASQG